MTQRLERLASELEDDHPNVVAANTREGHMLAIVDSASLGPNLLCEVGMAECSLEPIEIGTPLVVRIEP